MRIFFTSIYFTICIIIGMILGLLFGFTLPVFAYTYTEVQGQCTASATNYFDVYIPANAFDDNNNTAWTAANSNGEYLYCDLGTSKIINKWNFRSNIIFTNLEQFG